MPALGIPKFGHKYLETLLNFYSMQICIVLEDSRRVVTKYEVLKSSSELPVSRSGIQVSERAVGVKMEPII